MHETADDMQALRRVLDESYAKAGQHLLSIHGNPGWRMSAEEIVETLRGVCVLALATVNSRCEPFVGPVDGLFYRGRFWFGSAEHSLRFRHIRRRPQVSAAHTRGEELAVIVHGTARELDKSSEEAAGFRDYITEVYGPDTVDEHWGGAPYASIEPRRMFAVAPKI